MRRCFSDEAPSAGRGEVGLPTVKTIKIVIMTSTEVLRLLESKRNPRNIAGMARFGISPKNTLGVPMPFLRSLGKKIKMDHQLALSLWRSRFHEARILASLVGDPAKLTATQAYSWVRQIDSWDVCDQLCLNLLRRTPFAWKKAWEWSRKQETFVKRAGFVLMATLAVHDKKASDTNFRSLFPLLLAGARDERNFVRKAVNWAVRQIGKRNRALNRDCVALSRRIYRLGNPAARWIASDAIRELESGKIRARL
jgi:3-methyladenine DNA glycosylase AlkD